MKREFRDGWREVPEYLDAWMVKLETWTMTYDEAIAKVNWQLASDHANKAMDDIIREALKR